MTSQNRPFLDDTLIALSPAGEAVCIACGGAMTAGIQATNASDGSSPRTYISLFCTRQGCCHAFHGAGESDTDQEMKTMLREWAVWERNRLSEVGENDTFLVAFGVFDEPEGPVLCVQAEGNFQTLGFESRGGRRYENWQQLKGTLSEILGQPLVDFDALRDGVLRNQRVSRRQLRLLELPSLRHLMSAA